MNPVYITKTLAAASDNNVAANQTPGAAGNLTLNGTAVTAGVGIFDTPRRVLVTTASDESGKTLTIYGNQRIDGSGNAISEVMTGPNATTGQTNLDFGTVTRVAVSAAFTGNVKVGTNGVGSTEWKNVNYQVSPMNLSVGVVVTGTVNYTVQYTYDDFWTLTTGQTQATTPTTWDDPVLASLAVTNDTTLNDPITAWRVTINSGTGSIAVKGIQAGVSGPHG